MLFNVNVLNSDLNNVSGLEELGGVLNELIGHFGDMKKTVVVNSDINEATKVNDVTNGTLELHIGLKVGYLENVGGEDGCGSIVTNISSGLLKLADDILEGGLTAAELAGKLCLTVLLCLES